MTSAASETQAGRTRYDPRSLATGLSALCLSYSADAQPLPDCGIYLYAGHVVRVIDGDTVDVDIDLGFDT